MNRHFSPTRASALLLGLSLAACGTFGLDSKPDTAGSDSGASADTLQIEDLSPTFGPLAGGTEVTITGSGFEGSIGASFGNAELAVTRTGPDTIVVTTPEVRAEATVDVTVWSDLGEVTLPDAFTFTDEDLGDGSGTGGGSGSGTGGGSGSGSGSGSGGSTGGVTTVVEMTYTAVPCMDCFGLTSQTFVDVAAIFHPAVSGSWTSSLPSPGTCAANPGSSRPTASSADVGSSVTLQTGGAALALSRTNVDGLTAYTYSSTSRSDYVASTSYDLAVAGGGTWGPFTAEDAVQTTSGFTDIQPLDVFAADPWSAFAPVFTSSLAFSWSPTSVGDRVVVDIQVYDQLSGSPYPNGNIVCVGNDTGSLSVPASYFGSFYQGDLASIYVYRWSSSVSTHPVDGSTIEGITSFGAIGTATLY